LVANDDLMLMVWSKHRF